ncbi:MAG: hypothetical protein KatS3mg015_0947 [Fimbriimonadales bacterium]|nr:MAG: hypothetical protein KatS3mg015_0947 [Fimbriimonadales bacterium]
MKKMTKTVFLAMAAAVAVSASAQTKVFKLTSETPPQQRIATVFSNADFEDFTGVTHDVIGTVRWDPQKKTGSGSFTVNVKSIDTGIALRNEHMVGPMWMDAEKYPTITFESTNIKHKSGDTYAVTGKLTMHGVTKTITVDCQIRYLPESEATKKAMFKGDVLHVKSSFTVRLSDFGVMIPDMAKGRVADAVKITISAFAQTG